MHDETHPADSRKCNDTHTKSMLPFWYLPDRLKLRRGRTVYDAEIHTDFRVGIRLRCLWEEAYYLQRPRLLLDTARRLLFRDADAVSSFPDETVTAAAAWYLADGRIPMREIRRRIAESDVNNETDSAVPERAAFSYKWDMPLLYASFMQVYRLDLFDAALHLWQFDALVQALPETCVFRQTVALRTLELSSLPDDGTRVRAAAARLAVRLPDIHEMHEVCCDCYENSVVTADLHSRQV